MGFFDEENQKSGWSAYEADSAGEGHGPPIDWAAMAEELRAAGNLHGSPEPDEDKFRNYTVQKVAERVSYNVTSLLLATFLWNISGLPKVKLRQALALRVALTTIVEAASRSFLRAERQFVKDVEEMEEKREEFDA